MMIRRATVLVPFAMALACSPSEAQQVGGWLSANATIHKPATDSTTQAATFPYYSETFQSTDVYTEKQKPAFDVGGGIRFGQFGVGIAVTRYSDNEFATASISVPSQFFFGNTATASGRTTRPLTHEETAVHVEARYIANLPHASISVFAGPSYFKTTQDVVSDHFYDEIDNRLTGFHSVAITGYDTIAEDLHAWGYSVGADAGYYFSKYAGVGVLVRYSQATVKLPNPLSGATATDDLKVGGLGVGGGLRLRF